MAGDDTHRKNIIVVDEYGNEYEATFPKRATGLVKNGRARFIGENKICLACPPRKILEDQTVENTNLIINDSCTQADTLTEKEIFDHIAQLQAQMLQPYNSMSMLSESISSLFENQSFDEEGAVSAIQNICDAFMTRDLAVRDLIQLYARLLEQHNQK